MKTSHYRLADIMIDVTVSSEATIAVVQGSLDGEAYVWEGTAKRFPGDRFVPSIGVKLAVSRAFARASKQLAKQGNGMVKNMDDNAARPKVPRPKFHVVRSRRPKEQTKVKPVSRTTTTN